MFLTNLLAATTTGSVLAEVVTQEMMSGCLNEVIAIFPVCIPTMIGFISLRKGISFMSGILHAA